jgi:hypothetical protein
MSIQTKTTSDPAAPKFLSGQRDTANCHTCEDTTRSSFRPYGIDSVIAMDLETYGRINPCGYEGLQVTLGLKPGGPAKLSEVMSVLIPELWKRADLRPKFTPATALLHSIRTPA